MSLLWYTAIFLIVAAVVGWQLCRALVDGKISILAAPFEYSRADNPTLFRVWVVIHLLFIGMCMFGALMAAIEALSRI